MTDAIYDSMILGHISKDINVDHEGHEVRVVGGAVFCSAAAAAALGHRVEVVTKLSPDDQSAVSEFPESVARVTWTPSTITTSIENVYSTADKERRVSTAISQAEGFTVEDIPATPARIFHLAGLMVGDFSPELVTALAGRGKVAVDMQAFLRNRSADDGSMFFADFAQKRDLFPSIHFLKVDTAEAEVLTGLTDRRQMIATLQSWGPQEVMLTNAVEVLIHDGDALYACPLRARNLSGRTGRGDTVFAAYINERLTRSVSESLLTASAAVSLKMETPGPLVASRADIFDYQHEFYADLEGVSLEVAP